MDFLRTLGAAATLVVGAVHVEQYVDFIGDVPTIAELFLLNAMAAGVVAVLLATTRLRRAAAVMAIGLSAGALLSLGVARFWEGGLFGYTEPTLRAPVAVALTAEIAVVVLLCAYLVRGRGHAAGPP